MVRLYDRDGGADEYVELEIESINPNGFVIVFTEITKIHSLNKLFDFSSYFK